MLQLQNVWNFGGNKKKVLCKVWLKESTCWHAAFREQVIQSLLFTQRESGGERNPIHSA